MSNNGVDILMITHNRPDYTRRSLSRLLQTCDESTRVWLWQNGDHAETLEVLRSLASHRQVQEFHHSRENMRLREATNWFWANSRGELLGKVDDDCLVPDGWIQKLRQAHVDVPSLGIVSCWHFREEDYEEELARRKIIALPGNHQLMLNCWTGGSGYLMKRRCLEQQGLLGRRQTFTDYGISLARKGWFNGWYFPFLYQDHMDDPRSPHCRYRTEEDFRANPSLSARTFGIKTLEEFRLAHHSGALELQRASTDPRDYSRWRSMIKRFKIRV